MTDRLSLPSRYRRMMEDLLREHVPDAEVWAYGSRVNGGSHEGSDLDLVVRGPMLEPLGVEFIDLVEALRESNIPILVQAHDWANLPDSFHREIERDYVVVQSRGQGEWREAVWGELTTLEYGKSLRGYKSSDGRYKVYGTNGPIGWHSEPLCDKAGVIIGRKGAYRGVHYSPDPFFVIYTAFYLQPKVNLDTRWAYYHLLSVDINGMDSGSAIPSTSREDFYDLRVDVPPLPEQRAIAHVLGTLDDKIEMNRRMNETLEAMARALFRSWFVDFEPVRAKMEGRWHRGESLPGLPAEHYDLFPDRLVDSELGEIPEGWELGVLDDAVEILSGGTPKTSVQEYWDGDIPWYTAKDAPSLSDIFVLNTERSISQAGVQNSSTKVLPARTTVITARGTVGRLACLGVPMAMNQTCYGLRGASGYPDYFTYWNVRNTVSDLQARTHGTIFDTITRGTFKIAETVLAPPSVAGAFESVLGPLMKHILRNLNESLTLAEQRDALLSNLVSGKVRVA